MALLDDMEKYRIPMDSMASTTLIITLMQTSTGFPEAFQVYHRIRRFEGAILSTKGFAAVLHAFSQLQFGNKTIPPWRAYFQIVKDMREAGHPSSSHVYTNILRQMARVAAQLNINDEADEDIFRQLAIAIPPNTSPSHTRPIRRPGHRLLEPADDTYQRAACFPGCTASLEHALPTRKVDNVSISIMLDACGRAGTLHVAMHVYQKLHEDGYS